MRYGTSDIAPAEVRRAQQVFARWRAQKGPRERIPARLWRVAARLCRSHSVHQVARWLRLNHTSLQDQVGRRSKAPPPSAATRFIEWPAPTGFLPPIASTEYVVEVGAAVGETVRIRARGATVSEVAALVHALRRAGAQEARR